MSKPNAQKLQAMQAILLKLRALLAQPGNDFSWSSWTDGEQALAEIDGLLSSLNQGRLPEGLTLQVIFATTGPAQEVSLSSGWADRFIDLSERFDKVMAGI